MALDVKTWDERIRKDLEFRMGKFDKLWNENKQIIRNSELGKLKGNLVQDFIDTIQSRLIVRNPIIKVKADNADFSKRADDLEVASNSIIRVCDLKHHLTKATITATWASTGWIEVGHTMDQHNFDPMRSVLYRSPNVVDFRDQDINDNYVPIQEEEVIANVGRDVDDIPPFDPFEMQDIVEENVSQDPPPAFDPELGMPWLNEISPFMIVIPKENENYADLDYIAKLVVISKQELKLITNINVENVSVSNKYKPILNRVSGYDRIDDPVLICVTHIRRDRNAPDYTNWYLVHVLGYPDIIIKSDANPFGGLIPLIPITVSPIRDIWDTSIVEDLKPYAEWYSAGVSAIGDRLYETLNQKVLTGAGAAMESEEIRKLLNARYSGEVKVNGDPAGIKTWEGPGIQNEQMQLLSFFQTLAQGAAGASDIDRGVAVKKITARQTEALLNATSLRVSGMREVITRATKEIIVKLMHLVGIFSLYRSRRFTFGTRIANLEPGVNDFSTSYSYNIDVRDMEPPANAEEQLVFVQFLRLLMMDPTPERLLVQQWNWAELAEMIRVKFDMPPEVIGQQDLQQLPQPGMGGGPGMAGGPPQGGPPQGGMGGPEHAERFPADQGGPDLNNLMSGLRQLK